MTKDDRTEKCRKFVRYILPALLIIGSCIVDISIKRGVIKKYIVVNENYIFYVFSALVTIATLCCTMLSIISSVSNNKILGLELKEIISFKSSPISMKRLLILVLSY